MTTQNTHSEHSDVEASVVEHLSVSETNASIPSSESAVPHEQVASGTDIEGNLSGEQVTQHRLQEEVQSPNPDMPIQDPQEVSSVEPADAPPTPSVANSLIGEEEVRPFTDFIEEFRQAETRFNSSLQAYQAEALSFPSLSAEDVAVEGVQDEASAFVYHPPTENTSDDPGNLFTSSQEGTAPDIEQQFVESTTPFTLKEQTEAEQIPTEDPTPNTEIAPVPTRPVSPLLRPASRLRLPRHGSVRQRDEHAIEKVSPPETPTHPTGPAEEAKVESIGTQEAHGEEQPRPARRYRFDRPAAFAGNSTPSTQAPTRSDEPKDAANRSATPIASPNDYVINGQTSEKEVSSLPQARQGTNGTQLPEQDLSKQSVVQEVPVAETAPVKTSTSEQDRRRRHGQGQDRQRGKEQSAAPVTNGAPVAEAAPTIPEMSGAKQEEVNPEDLPPLEYAEIQKANSRRRRRRHVGGTTTPAAAGTPPPVATTKAAAPEILPVPPVAVPTPTPAVAVPPTPGQANQFAITSGFTVSQMNQTHDGSSPFMGPEPSPARGSAAAQQMRSIRTDVQRTPAYPVRTTEATSASVHQLASVVAQAIQTQTDRMIAELRRANQTPTNISVSLPPFPSNERVGVFVDVANLLYSARTLRMTVDFGKLLDFLRGNRRLIRAHAYCPTSPQAGDEQMFLQAVKGLGYRITTKNYKTFSSGAKKADLDLDLCMDVVRLVDGKAVDCVVLVSGDSDFMPMLDYCSDHGVRVEVAAFDEAMSATLRQSCDLFINLSMLDEIRV